MNGIASIFFRIPVFIFLACTRNNHVASILWKLLLDKEYESNAVVYLRIRLYLEPAVAQVALAPERKNGSRIVYPNLLFLCIVPYAHANMIVARTAE